MKLIHRASKAAEHVTWEMLPVPHPVVFALHTTMMAITAATVVSKHFALV